MEQIEDQSVKEGEVLTEQVKERLFQGEKVYDQMLNWLNFARPSQFQMQMGRIGGTQDGELAIRVVYVK